MTQKTVRHGLPWVLPSLIALNLMLIGGCSGRAAHASTANIGSSCYAKALPTSGEGGLAWGNTLSMAHNKSLNNCIRYAGRSGGTPDTCQVVLAECRK